MEGESVEFMVCMAERQIPILLVFVLEGVIIFDAMVTLSLHLLALSSSGVAKLLRRCSMAMTSSCWEAQCCTGLCAPSELGTVFLLLIAFYKLYCTQHDSGGLDAGTVLMHRRSALRISRLSFECDCRDNLWTHFWLVLGGPEPD